MEDSAALILIHIPSPLTSAAGIFGWPMLWLGTFGIGELVSFLQGIRWSRALTQANRYLVAIALLATLACVLSWRSWLPAALLGRGGLPAAVLGVLLAFPVLSGDGALARSTHRRLNRRTAKANRAQPAPARRAMVRPVAPEQLKSPGVTNRSSGQSVSGPMTVVTPVQVAIGVLEEVVFRGGLLTFALCLRSDAWAVVCIVLGSGLFLLNHYDYGLHQLVAKVPLLAGCLALTLATGSIIGAVTLHATFNYLMARRLRRRGMS
jgi:membrane protease YdiL (CAAX protease family)